MHRVIAYRQITDNTYLQFTDNKPIRLSYQLGPLCENVLCASNALQHVTVTRGRRINVRSQLSFS